jgi:hypothetical protein
MANNNAPSTLAAGIAATATAITIAPGTGAKFSTGTAILYATGVIELVQITQIAGDVLTVTRGYGGTAPAAWSTGTSIVQGMTGTGVNDLLTAQVNAFRAGITMTGDTYSGYGDPTADLHAAQKSWFDNTFYPASQPVQLNLGFTPIQKYWETQHSVAIGWNGNLYLVIDGTYAGKIWTDYNFNPGSKAAKGSWLQWNSGIVEFGRVDVGFGAVGTMDIGSPWVQEGFRSEGGNDFEYYIRAVWMRNQ